jgi:hypothetical protein
MIELGTIDELEPALEAEGFFAREGFVARTYGGYGCGDGLRRSGRPAPPDPCALPALAVSIVTEGAPVPADGGAFQIGEWRQSWSDEGYARSTSGSAVGSCGTPIRRPRSRSRSSRRVRCSMLSTLLCASR